MRTNAPRHLMVAAVIFSAGCGGTVMSGDENGDLTPSPDSVGVPATSDGAYPYCKAGMGFESFCGPTYKGWGYLNWHTDDEGGSYCSNDDSCNTCLCFVGCSYDPDEPVDCPQPETGTAEPECLGAPSAIGTCMLTCDNGEQCPTGMRCVENNEFRRQVCAWVCDL